MTPIVDANTLFGFWQCDYEDRSLQRLLRIMDLNGIGRALTLSARGVWHDTQEGNQETLEVCRRNPRLIPVAVIRPADFFTCLPDIATFRERGFRMIRFCTSEHGGAIRSLAFRRLADALVQARLPLFFEPGADKAALVDLFIGTDLPLLFSGVSYDLAEFLAACEVYPACYTDTSQLFLFNQLEIIRDHAGIDRLLFGTRAPFDMPGPSLETIRHSRLSDEEKRRVLGQNVLRLIGE